VERRSPSKQTVERHVASFIFDIHVDPSRTKYTYRLRHVLRMYALVQLKKSDISAVVREVYKELQHLKYSCDLRRAYIGVESD
jgi:hypothetical protein